MRCRMLLLLWILLVSRAIFAQDSEIESLVQKIEERMERYVDYDSFSAAVVSTSREMDKKWNPKKVVVVEKQIIQQGEKRREVILKATEFKKGVEKDVTAEHREYERKRMEKAEKRRREREGKKKQDGDGEGSFSLSMDELFPFAPEKQEKFFFHQFADTVIDGRAVICLETRAKEQSEKLYEGNYYVDRETYDVLMVDVSPSKNPKFVKEMHLKMWFDVLDENYYVIKAYWMRVYAGIFIKKIRMEVEETYKNYRIDVKETGEG